MRDQGRGRVMISARSRGVVRADQRLINGVFMDRSLADQAGLRSVVGGVS